MYIIYNNVHYIYLESPIEQAPKKQQNIAPNQLLYKKNSTKNSSSYYSWCQIINPSRVRVKRLNVAHSNNTMLSGDPHMNRQLHHTVELAGRFGMRLLW